MKDSTTTKSTLNVRAEIPQSTHNALRIRQSKKEIDTGTRPHMTEVVAEALGEWAETQRI